MKPYFFLLGLLSLRISAESQESEETATKASKLSADEGSNDADPFVSNSLSEDDPASDNNNFNESNLTENEVEKTDGMALSQENSSGVVPGSKESLGMAEDKASDNPPELISSNELFGFNSGSSKSASRYWTEVVINDKSSNVLVNIKTVTIIESMSTVKPKTTVTAINTSVTTKTTSATAKTPTTGSVSTTTSATASASSAIASETFPYIKIQMPSSQYASASKSILPSTAFPKTQHKHRRTTHAIKLSTTQATSKMSDTLTATSIQSKTRTHKSKTSTVKSSTLKTVAPIGPSGPTKSTKKASSIKKTPQSTTASVATTIKGSTSSAIKTSTTTTKTEDPGTVGSIFNVLRNLPSGGQESASVFIEGKFTFPKKKEISNKVFKLSGYISQS